MSMFICFLSLSLSFDASWRKKRRETHREILIYSLSLTHTHTHTLFLSVTHTQDIVKESQKRRYKSVEIVDQCIEKDAQWRSVRSDLDKLNADFKQSEQSGGFEDEIRGEGRGRKLMPEVKRVDQLRKVCVCVCGVRLWSRKRTSCC